MNDALAVSCGGPGSCMLVGEHYNNPRLPVQFAELLDGSPLIWNNPVKAKWSLLDDVKCAGAAFCMAVGTYSATAGGGRVLAEKWNGASWKRLAAPSPGGSLNSDLGELYCLSVSDCLAVGVRETKAKHIVSFTERWNGSRWKLGTMPSVRGERDTVLNDVSCTAPGTCVAVGFTRSSSSSPPHPLAMTLNAGRWTIVRTPKISQGTLNGVSCPASADCVAVGAAGTRPLAELWNGSRWIFIAPIETGGTRPDAGLLHVFCTSVSHCVAVGFRYNVRHRFSNHTLIEVRDRSSWHIQASVDP